MVRKSSQWNSNDKRHQVEELFHCPFSESTEKAEDENDNGNNINPYHITIILKYLPPAWQGISSYSSFSIISRSAEE